MEEPDFFRIVSWQEEALLREDLLDTAPDPVRAFGEKFAQEIHELGVETRNVSDADISDAYYLNGGDRQVAGKSGKDLYNELFRSRTDVDPRVQKHGVTATYENQV